MHCHNYEKIHSRRDFLSKTSLGLGAAALASLINPLSVFGNNKVVPNNPLSGGILGKPHFAPKAKRVIYLFQSGGPSQLELFDYKPMLQKMRGEDLPESQRGQSGAWISDLMPHTAKIADDLCFVKSMYTEAINHDPAITFIQTGSQLPGRPSIGSWLNYGLGSDNENLPGFVVLVTKNKYGQPLYSRLWGNGFLPSQHQGVQFRAGKDPVLYLNNPEGITNASRRDQLNYLKKLQEMQFEKIADPEIEARIAQYEMAYRMQTSVPEVTDTSKEPDYIYEMYGEDSRKPGTYAANALLARRLAEKGVKFIQLYHQGWDQHGGLPNGIKNQCKETDQATAALITDLKQRGLLEDTLVVWGGEFGRTSFSQGRLTVNNYGRDHHPGCFTIWMAGAGVKKGMVYGKTDEFSYNVVENPVHVHDFQSTLLHLLGIDHEQLIFKHQGRRFRLTDVHGHVVKDILA